MRNNILLGLSLTLVLAASVAQIGRSQTQDQGQTQAAAKSNTKAEGTGEAIASGENGPANLRSGTKIAARLESTVDARTAKAG
jgi:hypothetical protein